MTELYPFLLEPEFKERPWGARDLSPIYDKKAEGQPIGEAWLTADTCKVANGPLKGRSLQDLCREYGKAFLGDNCPNTSRFPLLIKFLFPREKLSVQVHPDDEAARRIGQPCGKTECWYVLDAQPGAQVGLGLKPGITKQQLAEAIAQKRAELLLNWIPINKGELIYVDAGTVHAIGPGSILVETQQNSDTTYRLYDYGRPRELHVEQGLMAAKEKTRAGKVKPSVVEEDPTRVRLLVSPPSIRLVQSPCFEIWKRHLGPGSMVGRNDRVANFRIVVALSGGGRVNENLPGVSSVAFHPGDVIVIPASVSIYEVEGQWEADVLDITLAPTGATAQPETSLTGFDTAAEP